MQLLASEYALQLHRRAAWVVNHFDDLTEASLRARMRSIFDAWSEEFEPVDGTKPRERS